MLRGIKRWFGFPLVTEYQKEVEKILKERLEELEMAEKKSTAKKKAPVKKTAPAKKKPATKKAPVKKAK